MCVPVSVYVSLCQRPSLCTCFHVYGCDVYVNVHVYVFVYVPTHAYVYVYVYVYGTCVYSTCMCTHSKHERKRPPRGVCQMRLGSRVIRRM